MIFILLLVTYVLASSINLIAFLVIILQMRAFNFVLTVFSTTQNTHDKHVLILNFESKIRKFLIASPFIALLYEGVWSTGVFFLLKYTD